MEHLRAALSITSTSRIAFVGSGGKSTAIFRLARQHDTPVIISATSHLEISQTKQADRHFCMDNETLDDFSFPEAFPGITLFSGPRGERSVSGLGLGCLQRVLSYADAISAPLLIEADGSRRHPLKAPASHEPPIPDFVDTVVVVVGLSALGKPFSADYVHRPEIYARLSGLREGETISVSAIQRVLSHPKGCLKNIPQNARRVLLLNQADTFQLQEAAEKLKENLLSVYDEILSLSLIPGAELQPF